MKLCTQKKRAVDVIVTNDGALSLSLSSAQAQYQKHNKGPHRHWYFSLSVAQIAHVSELKWSIY